jgi:hypothetical protein
MAVATCCVRGLGRPQRCICQQRNLPQCGLNRMCNVRVLPSNFICVMIMCYNRPSITNAMLSLEGNKFDCTFPDTSEATNFSLVLRLFGPSVITLLG